MIKPEEYAAFHSILNSWTRVMGTPLEAKVLLIYHMHPDDDDRSLVYGHGEESKTVFTLTKKGLLYDHGYGHVPRFALTIEGRGAIERICQAINTPGKWIHFKTVLDALTASDRAAWLEEQECINEDLRETFIERPKRRPFIFMVAFFWSLLIFGALFNHYSDDFARWLFLTFPLEGYKP